MASVAPVATASVWQRLFANLAAFSEAAETDGFTAYDRRIASLERRIGALEGTGVDTNPAYPARPRS